MITGSHVWRETIDILGLSGLDATITQERIPVLVPVGDIIILDPGIFDGFQEMNGLFHPKSATAVTRRSSKLVVNKEHTEPGQR